MDRDWKYQVSIKKGEDILVVRGDTIDALVLDVAEAKTKVFTPHEKPAFESTESSSSPSSSVGTTYVCNTCGKPATLKEGINKLGNPYKLMACSSGIFEHGKFL